MGIWISRGSLLRSCQKRLRLVCSQCADQYVPCTVKAEMPGLGLVRLIDQSGTKEWQISSQNEQNIAQETILW